MNMGTRALALICAAVALLGAAPAAFATGGASIAAAPTAVYG